MPSPRTTSKDSSSGKRPAAGVGRTGAVSPRSSTAKSPPAKPEAATPEPIPAPAPKAVVEKQEAVSLISEEKPAAATPKKTLKPLPTIGRKAPAPVVAAAPAPVVRPAPVVVPKAEVVDLISTRTARPAQSAPGLTVPPTPPLAPPGAPSAPSGGDGRGDSHRAVPTIGLGSEGEGDVPAEKVLHIKPPIVVKDLAVHLGLKLHQINRDLIAMDIFASPTQVLEQDIVQTLCKKHGFTLEVERRERGAGVHRPEIVVAAPVAPVIVNPEEELKPRAPIITFMGHVDHGKTSLMDAVRKTRVAKPAKRAALPSTSAPIASSHNGQARLPSWIRPGHAAFTAMRARAARTSRTSWCHRDRRR